MAHIKRAKVAEEAKKEAENPIKGKNTLLIIHYWGKRFLVKMGL